MNSKTVSDIYPSIAEIDLAAIRDNVRRIVAHVQPAEVMAVVKADGYGHGAVQIARTALQAGAKRLAAAHAFEGVALRKAGLDAPIQVMGGFFPEQMPCFLDHRLEFTLSHFEQADALAEFSFMQKKRFPVHLKFDTGMGRLGFAWENALSVFEKLRKTDIFDYVGLMTHFATSEATDKSFANLQLRRFQHVIEAAESLELSFQYIHAANSGGILNLPDAKFNLVRPGLIIYGYSPSEEIANVLPLQPALRWRSKITQVKTLKKDETVSYGATWQAPKNTKIGVVPVGYADGWRRALSNRMEVLVNGKRVPIVGRICMDMTMLDLGLDSQARPGDEVVLVGKQGNEEIAVQEICEALGTIPYEVICGIGKRVLRVYI